MLPKLPKFDLLIGHSGQQEQLW